MTAAVGWAPFAEPAVERKRAHRAAGADDPRHFGLEQESPAAGRSH